MEVAREAGARAARGERIVRLDVGQPFCGAPQAALAAAAQAARDTALPYSDALGDPRLRAAIAARYGRLSGVEVSPERVAITAGASAGFVLAFLALFDPGDRIAIAAPGYPPYRHILASLGLAPTIIPGGEAEGFQLTGRAVSALAEAGPLAGALVASPANPTGAMLGRAELAALAEACRAAAAALISDEIYHGLAYGDEPMTALALDPDAIVINSFSKYWAMTGWRIGWIVVPEALLRPIERLAQSLFIAPSTPAQAAALAALTPEAEAECAARRALYAANREALLAALPRLGLPLAARPDGAFYLLLDASAHTDDSVAFCARLLEEAGVALTPGVDFDAERGARWIRLAYARTPAEVAEGLARLERVLHR